MVTKAFLSVMPGSLTTGEKRKLVWWGVFLAFAPDLDTFYSFYKSSSFIVNTTVANHRIYLTHTPVLWLAAGLLIFILAKKPYYKALGLLVWLASWSHFILDSIEYGVRWLWPFKNNLYAIIPGSHVTVASKGGFFSYWLYFLQTYSHTLTFYLEIIIIISAIIIFFRQTKHKEA